MCLEISRLFQIYALKFQDHLKSMLEISRSFEMGAYKMNSTSLNITSLSRSFKMGARNIKVIKRCFEISRSCDMAAWFEISRSFLMCALKFQDHLKLML